MISVLQQPERPAPQQTIPPAISEEIPEQGEFEIVMGRGQLASTMLMILVLLVIFSAGAYVIGKSSSPRSAAPVTAPAPVPPAVAQPEPAPAAAPKLPETTAPMTANLSAPLYADQLPGKVYLQVGAVEKGLAGVWAEGLRTHGLDAFVAPGPSDKMWRVVIGPLPDPDAFQRARDTLDKLGIATFGRKQQ